MSNKIQNTAWHQWSNNDEATLACQNQSTQDDAMLDQCTDEGTPKNAVTISLLAESRSKNQDTIGQDTSLVRMRGNSTTDSISGSVDLDFLKGKTRWDSQKEVSAALAQISSRVGSKTTNISGKMELLSGQISTGSDNPDGSKGMNVAVGVSAAAVEQTFTHSGNSLTVGVSVGASFELSDGVRDADHDGNLEECFRISLPFATVGACIERPSWLGKSARLEYLHKLTHKQ